MASKATEIVDQLADTNKAERHIEKQIALFGTFLSWRGHYKAPCEDLAERLIKRGWTLVATSMRLSKPARLVDMVSTAWRRRHSYSLGAVEVYSGPAFFWAEVVSFVLRLIGKPYVLTLHGGNLLAFAERWPKRVKRLLTSATKVTTPSGYFLDVMKPFRDDIVLIPNPIEIDKYRFRLRKKPKPRLVWLRSFRNIYNPPLVPKVLHLLLKADIDVRMRMIGPDSGDGSLRKTKDLARKLNVIDRADFAGGIAKEKVPANLEPHDIFINTTNIDNTPISVIEAMACGLCIVSTNVGGIPYMLDHEKDALLVAPNDAEAMANSVKRILTEAGLAEQLSQNARRKAEQFSWERVLPMWEDLLEGIITG